MASLARATGLGKRQLAAVFGAALPCWSWRQKRSRTLTTVLVVVATACLMLIELLHNHECSGDGCVLCLITAWAQALLFLCAGIGVVRPVIRVLARVRFVCVRIRRKDTSRKSPVAQGVRIQASLTPLALGVMLRI